MHKLRGILILFVCAVLLLPCVLTGTQMLTIRIWLFQVTLMEGESEPKQPEIVPLSLTPQLAALKDLAAGPEDQFKAAVIDALLEAKNLRTLNDLFFFKHTMREDLPFMGKSILGKRIAYRIDMSPKTLEDSQMALHVVVLKVKEGIIKGENDDRMMLRHAWEATQDEEKMDRIVDLKLVVHMGVPAVVEVPSPSRPYFMVVKVTPGEPEAKRRTTAVLKPPPAANLVPAPPLIERVLPSYPEELRRRHIQGDVGLRITIDEKGNVQMVEILASLHPYLDYAVSQAFQRWKFEPVLQNGKAIPAIFNYIFLFDPQVYSSETSNVVEIPARMDAAGQKELERVLGGCAEYCQKLGNAALFYICEETIKEATHALVSPDRLAELSLRARDTAVQVYEGADGQMSGWVVDKPQIMSIRNVERLSYECDYQLIRRFGDIEERRIVLKDNGRKITDRVDLLTDERYSTLSPIVSMLKLLDKDHQPLFNYRILKEEKVSGKEAYVMEAIPKLGDADGVRSAKAWVDKAGFQILKCEIEGVPLDGYDDVLNDAVLLNVKPFFLRTYEFRVEKSGLMFPDRTKVLIEYPSVRPNSRETKSKIELNYKDFKFFTVESEGEIKK
jgi:TonB family protein